MEDKNACVLLDIDSFKFINDSYGHLVGDQALVSFGQILKNICRERDIAVRWGGEEFLLLFFETGLEDAKKRTEQVLHALTNSFKQETALDIELTTSAGIALFEKMDPSGIDVIISHSDDALYQAKENGKNQMCIWTELTKHK